jgi:hypothetical protein
MDNTRILDSLERAQNKSLEYQAAVAAYAKLPPDEQAVVDAQVLALELAVKRQMRFKIYGFGVAGAFELYCRIGQFLARPQKFMEVHDA